MDLRTPRYTQLCRSGAQCQRQGCLFSHSGRYEEPCWFGETCTSSHCQYTHPGRIPIENQLLIDELLKRTFDVDTQASHARVDGKQQGAANRNSNKPQIVKSEPSEELKSQELQQAREKLRAAEKKRKAEDSERVEKKLADVLVEMQKLQALQSLLLAQAGISQKTLSKKRVNSPISSENVDPPSSPEIIDRSSKVEPLPHREEGARIPTQNVGRSLVSSWEPSPQIEDHRRPTTHVDRSSESTSVVSWESSPHINDSRASSARSSTNVAASSGSSWETSLCIDDDDDSPEPAHATEQVTVSSWESLHRDDAVRSPVPPLENVDSSWEPHIEGRTLSGIPSSEQNVDPSSDRSPIDSWDALPDRTPSDRPQDSLPQIKHVPTTPPRKHKVVKRGELMQVPRPNSDLSDDWKVIPHPNHPPANVSFDKASQAPHTEAPQAPQPKVLQVPQTKGPQTPQTKAPRAKAPRRSRFSRSDQGTPDETGHDNSILATQAAFQHQPNHIATTPFSAFAKSQNFTYTVWMQILNNSFSVRNDASAHLSPVDFPALLHAVGTYFSELLVAFRSNCLSHDSGTWIIYDFPQSITIIQQQQLISELVLLGELFRAACQPLIATHGAHASHVQGVYLGFMKAVLGAYPSRDREFPQDFEGVPFRALAIGLLPVMTLGENPLPAWAEEMGEPQRRWRSSSTPRSAVSSGRPRPHLLEHYVP